MRPLIVAFASLALTVSAQAAPLAPPFIPAANVVTAQGWPNWQGGWQAGPISGQEHERREYCWRLRHQEHEIRERIAYAPPWERGGMEHHLWEVRERLRGECRGVWRDDKQPCCPAKLVYHA
jgi:hypothetical protein